MEIIISLMLVVVLVMIYDLITAPIVDENENLLISDTNSKEEIGFSYEKIIL